MLILSSVNRRTLPLGLFLAISCIFTSSFPVKRQASVLSKKQDELGKMASCNEVVKFFVLLTHNAVNLVLRSVC